MFSIVIDTVVLCAILGLIHPDSFQDGFKHLMGILLGLNLFFFCLNIGILLPLSYEMILTIKLISMTFIFKKFFYQNLLQALITSGLFLAYLHWKPAIISLLVSI